MIQNRRFIYVTLSLVRVVLPVAANISTPSAVYAERIPFAIQNVTQSTPADLAGGLFQIATVLPQREDGKFYNGQITFTASVPVEVNILQPTVGNVSGAQPLSVQGLNATIASLYFGEPRQFNSLTFTGSEVTLIHRSPQPFIVSYSVVGEALDPEPLP